MLHRQAIAVLSLVGWFVSLYLWLYKIGAIGELQCGAGGCETVQLSPYADFLGLPVAFYGVAGYLVLFAISVLGVQGRWRSARWVTAALLVLAAVGLAFTIYLTYLELFVIHAICRWCVASAALITTIFLISVHAALSDGRTVGRSDKGPAPIS
jgi:uncharacterized membrane protein